MSTEKTLTEDLAAQAAPEVQTQEAVTEETVAKEPLSQEGAAGEAAESELLAEAALQEQETPAEEAAPAPAKETAGTPAQESMADYEAELAASLHRYHVGDIITGTVIGITDEAITLDFGSYTDGIIRQEDASDDPTFSIRESVHVGDKISATVLRTDDGAGHLLLSMKQAAALLSWDRLEALQESKENVQVKISGTTKSGVIAYLEGVRGFIPASKLALQYVEEEELPSWVGKTIEVRVISAEREGKRLVLSARDILWEKEREARKQRITNVQVGMITEGTVESIKPYGAFISLGKGLSGLLHVSQISRKRIKTPADVLKEGQTVKVKVIENRDGKLKLSMRVLEDEAPVEVEEETVEPLPEVAQATTSLGALLSGIKLD